MSKVQEMEKTYWGKLSFYGLFLEPQMPENVRVFLRDFALQFSSVN